MTTLSARDLALAGVLARQRKADDPLKHFHWNSPKTRAMVEGVAREVEIYLRGSNSSGKTRQGSVLGVALARGVREMDARTIREVRAGEPARALLMPRVPTPNIGILLIDSYKQGDQSTLLAYRQALGNHPYKEVRTAQGVSELRVKPDGSNSDDPNDWSRILVFPAEGTIPQGIRAHWAHADETPDMDMWREVRARVIQGLPMYRWITATPTIASKWHPLREDYGKEAAWKREIQMALRDNEALTPADVKRLEDMWLNDPLRDARLFGAYVNLDGVNPFYLQWRELQAWMDNTRDPVREETLAVMSAELDGKLTEAYGTVYVWEEPVPGERYYIPADCSLGVPDGEHDPCGLHVYAEGERGPRRMVARYNGYLGAYGLGWLACVLGERYNDAELDPDMTGGYGTPFLMATANYQSQRHPNGYGNISRDLVVDRPDSKWKQPYGFTLTGNGKAAFAESIRWALLRKAVDVPSAATVRCLQDAVMDSRQRLAKPPGVHYEDWDCLGRFCQRIMQDGDMRPAEYGRAENRDEIFDRSLGIRPTRVRTPGLSDLPWSLA